MEATILRSFVYEKKGSPQIRYSAGDVVSMSKNDFDHIQERSGGKYLKEGRYPFGNGVCYPCQKKAVQTKKKKTEVKTTKKIEENGK